MKLKHKGKYQGIEIRFLPMRYLIYLKGEHITAEEREEVEEALAKKAPKGTVTRTGKNITRR